ncbi:hypothetical protein BDV25DRAFT_128113 [Aspergillus avenaceus]|uniref:Uncharacterized protein n=1 Tax=Aspergillus avenaceus TaxID=36643 RepID=A0A5N6U119_ASPAV|nr:hypothetical protein BDV25DRAFT_128113 [Aspergillus avenaceus]
MGNSAEENLLIDIKSSLVYDVLYEVLPHERAALDAESSLKWPNNSIYRWRNHIKQAAEDRGPLCIKHVNVLLGLVQEEYGQHISDINSMFSKGTTTFAILREGFFPGDIIVNSRSKNAQAYRVTEASYRMSGNGRRFLVIVAQHVNFDGAKFGTVNQTFEVDDFDGIRYFSGLSVFPIKWHPGYPGIVDHLVARGQTFVSLKGQYFKAYRSENSLSRVMVDTASMKKLGKYQITVKGVDNELVDDPVFSFETKQCFTVPFALLEDIDFNTDIFHQLVLPQSTKEIVRAMVKSHLHGLNFDDFTKEVAEYSQRPLYVVSSGELGANPSEVESNLTAAMNVAKAFRAVLLLDEADVFMEERSSHDIIHNALVSVFLRLLEYYEGILILTTNRVKLIDDAFHSRVHITLKYPSLSTDAKGMIWRNFAQHLAAHDLNGRQIKNVFSLCKALSADKGTEISMDLIKMVLDVMESQTPKLCLV